MLAVSMFVTTMSRIQFALTAIVHFFFVPTTVGLMAATRKLYVY